MGIFSFLRSVYTLDTLDTRFETPSSASYRTVIDTRADPGQKDGQKERIASRASPSRWNTAEFYLYYVVVGVCIPWMMWIAHTVSRPSDPRYHQYERWLNPGWVPGVKIDETDAQYFSFRHNLKYLSLLLILHPLCRKAWNKFYRPLPVGKTPADTAEARLEQRISFDHFFAIIFLTALHGFSVFKVLAILYLNYNLATSLPRKYVPVATWTFGAGILFANELCGGYKYRDIGAILSGTSPFSLHMSRGDSLFMSWGAWLDSWGGIMSRWQILFNITVLRLISFNLDYYWSRDYRSSSPIEVRSPDAQITLLCDEVAESPKKKQLDPSSLSERDRVTIPAPARDFTFRNYLAYAIYAPLYLTGPIMTFNDYISQQRHRVLSIETGRTVRYAVRFLLCLLCMELTLHFVYVGAITHAGPVWDSYTPAQLGCLSVMNIMIIWMKLLLPWRLFRLWALLDGVDPPENMVRCVTDNWSTTKFWRGWHRSYNKWLVRYLWIPLGGANFSTPLSSIRSIGGYLLIFTWVALWHDIKLRLLVWSWLIVLFLLPELVAGMLFPKRKFEGRETQYRMLCAWGGVANTMLMMIGNLVGFAFGLDGLQSVMRGILRDFSGVVFLSTSCLAIFMAVQLMFEVRQNELRRGVDLKC